tara:strand:- start:91 stop:348 length:258 start_codon:yes stop_codon:yes gene_type:complete
MNKSILSAIEGRFIYYRKKYPKYPVNKASIYSRNWAHGVYRWTFGEEPPEKWKSEIDQFLLKLENIEYVVETEDKKLDDYVTTNP